MISVPDKNAAADVVRESKPHVTEPSGVRFSYYQHDRRPDDETQERESESQEEESHWALFRIWKELGILGWIASAERCDRGKE